MYYLAIICTILSSFSSIVLQNKFLLLFIVLNLLIGIFCIYQISLDAQNLLALSADDGLFFSKIGDIDIFTFASKLPIKNIEIIAIIFAILLANSYLNTIYFIHEKNQDKIDTRSKFTFFLMTISTLLLAISSDTFQLIMSWLFISAVLYYSINNRDYDASEIDNILYTSILLVISDALFIAGIITLTYDRFAYDTGILNFIEWDLMWLMNPLGSMFIIISVVFKSATIGLNSWINHVLYKSMNIINVYIYSIYTNLVGCIALTHFSDYILQSPTIARIAIAIFLIDLIANFIKCILDVNINRIVTSFCLANFDYIFIIYFIGYKEFFVPLFITQFLVSTVSFSTIFTLVKVMESNDIRDIHFDNFYKNMIILVIGITFLPQLAGFLLTNYDINKIMFLSKSNIINSNLILIIHMTLSLIVFFRTVLIISFYKNKKELLFIVDTGKLFINTIIASLIALFVIIIQTFLIYDVNFVINAKIASLFDMLHISVAIFLGILLYNIINQNIYLYSNLHRQYSQFFLFLDQNFYFKFILKFLFDIFSYLKLLIEKFYLFTSNKKFISTLFYGFLFKINVNFFKLQQADILTKVFFILVVFLVIFAQLYGIINV